VIDPVAGQNMGCDPDCVDDFGQRTSKALFAAVDMAYLREECLMAHHAIIGVH